MKKTILLVFLCITTLQAERKGSVYTFAKNLFRLWALPVAIIGQVDTPPSGSDNSVLRVPGRDQSRQIQSIFNKFVEEHGEELFNKKSGAIKTDVYGVSIKAVVLDPDTLEWWQK